MADAKQGCSSMATMTVSNARQAIAVAAGRRAPAQPVTPHSEVTGGGLVTSVPAATASIVDGLTAVSKDMDDISVHLKVTTYGNGQATAEFSYRAYKHRA
jgi:hypothetical protein